jgi:hypothetical protein
MMAIMILLNNLLYTLSQTTIATDNVDEEYIERPKRWDISFIRNFMIVEGPLSSIFDYATFFTMYLVFSIPITATALGIPLATGPQQHMFQTAWFVESLITQTLVVFVIRTRVSPFWKSKPGKYLVLSSLSIVAAALIIPYTPIGKLFDFVPPPPLFYAFLALFIVVYLFLAEAVKKWFYKRHAFRIEQALVPKRKTFYLSKSARLVQDVAAVVCLREENEISFDSLLEDLSRSLNYPIDSDRVYQSLQYLRRGGLIDIDWHSRIIKRTAPIKEYITKRVATSATWSLVYDDWLRINRAIQDKYGKANPDFQDLFSPRQH